MAFSRIILFFFISTFACIKLNAQSNTETVTLSSVFIHYSPTHLIFPEDPSNQYSTDLAWWNFKIGVGVQLNDKINIQAGYLKYDKRNNRAESIGDVHTHWSNIYDICFGYNLLDDLAFEIIPHMGWFYREGGSSVVLGTFGGEGSSVFIPYKNLGVLTGLNSSYTFKPGILLNINIDYLYNTFKNPGYEALGFPTFDKNYQHNRHLFALNFGIGYRLKFEKE